MRAMSLSGRKRPVHFGASSAQMPRPDDSSARGRQPDRLRIEPPLAASPQDFDDSQFPMGCAG
jgi:hypothetical protein